MSDLICLLVDDASSIRTYLRAILERERFNCLEAENAARALRIAQKLGGRIDLIISDIKMPGDMDGVDLAHSIRNTYPDLPVILISGYTEQYASLCRKLLMPLALCIGVFCITGFLYFFMVPAVTCLLACVLLVYAIVKLAQ